MCKWKEHMINLVRNPRINEVNSKTKRNVNQIKKEKPKQQQIIPITKNNDANLTCRGTK